MSDTQGAQTPPSSELPGHPSPAPQTGAWPPAPPGYAAPVDLRAAVPRFEPVAGLSRALVILLGACMAMYALTALLELLQALAGPSYPLRIALVICQICGLVLYPTIVVFLIWVYRCYRNLAAFGAGGLSTSAGWAVVYYFIPILSLYRPYQLMQETWKASEPGLDLAHAPAGWQKVRSSNVVGWWWAVWLISNLAASACVFYALSNPGLKATSLLTFSAELFSMISCIFAIRLVRKLSARQQESARRLAGRQLP